MTPLNIFHPETFQEMDKFFSPGARCHFYLQDSRQYVGNDVLWWAQGGDYTTDLSKARLFTRDEAQRQHTSRPTDIPWPKEYIDGKTRPAVDMQYIRRDEALAGTGIVLVKPKKEKPERIRCHACGCFMSPARLWHGICLRCELRQTQP